MPYRRSESEEAVGSSQLDRPSAKLQAVADNERALGKQARAFACKELCLPPPEDHQILNVEDMRPGDETGTVPALLLLRLRRPLPIRDLESVGKDMLRIYVRPTAIGPTAGMAAT